MNVITYCTSDCQIHVLKKYNNLKHKALKCKADIFFNNCVVVSEGKVCITADLPQLKRMKATIIPVMSVRLSACNISDLSSQIITKFDI